MVIGTGIAQRGRKHVTAVAKGMKEAAPAVVSVVDVGGSPRPGARVGPAVA
jgi:hypothetical protein